MSPAPASSARRGNVRAAILEGLRFLAAHPVLRWVTVGLVVAALAVRPYAFLLPAYAVHVLKTDARGLGLLMAAAGGGGMLGAAFTAATGGRRRGAIWLGSAAIAALGVLVLGLFPSFGAAALVLVVVGVATLSFMGSSNILIQVLASDEIRGRAVSVYSMIMLGIVPLGSLLVGSVATVLGLRWTFVLAGAVAFVWTVWAAFAEPHLRDA